MPLGTDQQHYTSREEQDKIRRRLELKDRLKQEGLRKRFSPFFQMHKIPFSDPAVDRYMDLRKQGRMPGAPFGPKLYWSLLSAFVIPLVLLRTATYYERKDYLEKCSTGDYPLEKKLGKLNM